MNQMKQIIKQQEFILDGKVYWVSHIENTDVDITARNDAYIKYLNLKMFYELTCEFDRLINIHEKHLNNIKPSTLTIPIRRFLKRLDNNV